MPFCAQYLADIGLGPNPYPHAASNQIQRIYGTSRVKGRISHQFALMLWNQHLAPVYAGLAALPATQAGYDGFVIQAALDIEVTLSGAQKGGFGIAQKIVNLFMKDMWAYHLIPAAATPLLHAPVDRGVLNKLAHIPNTWNPWTAAVAGAPAAQTIVDYLAIQTAYRAFMATPAPAHPQIFRTLIEMDQFLWHKI